jgi:four helix bundle protein
VADLQVFRRAYQVSLEVHRVSLELPKIEQYGLADQIRRASKSIYANLTEGFAKKAHSQAEFRRYLLMAVGSSDEMQLWSNYCKDLGYVEGNVIRRWQDEYVAISKMLQGLIQRINEGSAES